MSVVVGKALLEVLRARRSSVDILEEQRVSSARGMKMLLFAEGELRCPRLLQPQHAAAPALCIADHPRIHPLLQTGVTHQDYRLSHGKAVI
jgi:hypothetical protein